MGVKKAEQGEIFKSTGFRAVVILALLCGVGWYSWGTYKKFNPPPAPPAMAEAGLGGGRMEGPPSPEQMKARMDSTMTELKFTDAQKAQMNEVWSKGMPQNAEEWRARRDAMQKIATVEQQQQFNAMRQARRTQMIERARRTMSPQDFNALQQRMERRGGQGRPGGAGR